MTAYCVWGVLLRAIRFAFNGALRRLRRRFSPTVSIARQYELSLTNGHPETPPAYTAERDSLRKQDHHPRMRNRARYM